jgi:hypothetical protein
VDIIQFRHAPALLGRMPHMQQPATQRAWDTFLRAVYGLPLSPDDLAVFRQHTGRTHVRPGGYPEAVLITGRQSGKSQTAGDIVVFEAVTAPRDGSADGMYALLIAQDQRGAIRTLFRYASAPFEHRPFSGYVAGRTAATLALKNGVVVAAYPCRPPSIRGLRARVVVIDELAFFRSTDNIPLDTEMLRAVRPTLATTGGKLIILSSPYASTGALWEIHRQHYGRDDSSTLVWVASAPAMNPTLPADYIQRMQADDPEAYRSEVLGEFRAGLTTLLDPAALEECVADRRELLPAPTLRYVGYYDASGGQKDAAAAAVGHLEGGCCVVDAVRAWPAPHDPRAVIAEAAEFFRRYRVRKVHADRYGGQFPVAELLSHGIVCEPSPFDRSALYLDLLPRVLAGPDALELPNDPDLLRELRGLERRRGFAGRDRVDHRPGSHDDRATVAAGVVAMMASKKQRRKIFAL